MMIANEVVREVTQRVFFSLLGVGCAGLVVATAIILSKIERARDSVLKAIFESDPTHSRLTDADRWMKWRKFREEVLKT